MGRGNLGPLSRTSSSVWRLFFLIIIISPWRRRILFVSQGERPRALLSPTSVHETLTTNEHLATSVQRAEAEQLLKRRNPRTWGRAGLSVPGNGLSRWCSPVCSWWCFVQARLRVSHSSAKRSWFSYLLQVVSQLICPGTKEEPLCLGFWTSLQMHRAVSKASHNNLRWDSLPQTSFDWPSSQTTWATAPGPLPSSLLGWFYSNIHVKYQGEKEESW